MKQIKHFQATTQHYFSELLPNKPKDKKRKRNPALANKQLHKEARITPSRKRTSWKKNGIAVQADDKSGTFLNPQKERKRSTPGD
ncbi:hypothetical protein TNCV_4460021 [Trichonephila clavipes]|nr:hypothetical protein TNCV_4460021 [Trichonephila clavipes]